MRSKTQISFAVLFLASCATLSRLEAPEFVAPHGCPTQVMEKKTLRHTAFPWLRKCEDNCSGARFARGWVECCLQTLVPERSVCASYCTRENPDCYQQCTDNMFCTVALAADCVGLPLSQTAVREGMCSQLVPAVPEGIKVQLRLDCREPPAAPLFRVFLKWKPSLGAKGYRIEQIRGEDARPDYTAIVDGIPTNEYLDTVYYGHYSYKIYAISAAGLSKPSEVISVAAKESNKNHCLHPSPLESP